MWRLSPAQPDGCAPEGQAAPAFVRGPDPYTRYERLMGRRGRSVVLQVVVLTALHGAVAVALAYTLGQLGNALPLSGGVGGVEPLMLGVLTASGVDAGLAAAAIVLCRFVSLGLQALAGAIAVATLTTAGVDSGPLRASSETNDHTGGTP